MNEPMFSLHQSEEGAAHRTFAVPGRKMPRGAASEPTQSARRIAPLERPATT